MPAARTLRDRLVEYAIVGAGLVAVATWIYLIVFRGAFWRIGYDEPAPSMGAARSVVAAAVGYTPGSPVPVIIRHSIPRDHVKSGFRVI